MPSGYVFEMPSITIWLFLIDFIVDELPIGFEINISESSSGLRFSEGLIEMEYMFPWPNSVYFSIVDSISTILEFDGVKFNFD